MRYIQYVWLALFLPSITLAAIDLDVDKNGATDVNRGGSNATTAAGARSNLGLGNVTNTSDANKPVSTAQQSALDLKSNITCFADASAFNTCFGLDWITAAGIGLGTTDSPAFTGLTLGIANTSFGTLGFYGNSKTYPFSLWSDGADVGSLGWKLPSTLPSTASLISSSTLGYLSYVDLATFLTPTGVGGALTVTASGFDGNLATTDNTLQEIAQKIDDLDITGGTGDDLGGAAYTDVVALWTTCTGYLKSDGSCDVPSGSYTSEIGQDMVGAMVTGNTETGISVTYDDADGTLDFVVSTASTSNVGMAPQATAPAAGMVNVLGIANGETAYANKALFDATSPSTQAFGDSAAGGSAVVPARRDHKHAMPAAQTATTTAFTPNGTIAATNVQAAIQEVRDEAGGSFDPASPGAIGGTTPAAGTFTTLTASSVTSSSADGAHYLDVVNGVAISSTPTLGRSAYYNGRMRLADGTDWDGYFLEDTDLGTNVATFLATPSSANLRGAVTDESGTGALIFAGGDIAAATATTATAGDSDTSVATTAFVQGEVDGTLSGTHSSPSTTNPLAPTWAGPMHTVWYGVTGEIDLPAASAYAGRGILIYNTGAYTVTIDPNSSEVIVRDGTAQTGGVAMTLSSGAGNYVALVCDGVRWVTVGFKGTLAAGS